MFVCSVFLRAFFYDCYLLLSTATLYSWWPYTIFDGYILLSTAIYYFRRYTLLLALPGCDFVRIQDFPAIPRIRELKTKLEFNINLLTLIQFSFFCSSVMSFINFNSPFWKCCFIKNAQMLEMWNFLRLVLQMGFASETSNLAIQASQVRCPSKYCRRAVAKV